MRLKLRLLTVSAAIIALLIHSGCGGSGVLPGENVLLNPEDVTPYWLNFSVRDIATDGDLVYLTSNSADNRGLLIFDYSDRPNPRLVGSLEIEGYFYEITVAGNYVYLVRSLHELCIVDISSPQSPRLISTIELEQSPNSINVVGGYAYISGYNPELQIIDVDPPESAHIVGVFDTEYYAGESVVSGNFLYIAGQTDGLLIVDISNPESPQLINTVKTPNRAYDVAVLGDFAYVAVWEEGLFIIEISNPETAEIAGTVKTERGLSYVGVKDGYAYGAIYDGFYVFDVDPPDEARVILSRATPDSVNEMMVEGNLIYLVCSFYTGYSAGFYVLLVADISDPEFPSDFSELETLQQIWDVSISDGYAFTVSSLKLQIVDITPPDSARIVKSFEIQSPRRVEADGGYAFVSTQDNGLFILDIDPVETAHFCGSLSTVECDDMAFSNGYLYATGESVYIVDVTPPTSPQIINQFELGWGSKGIDVSQGYAYIVYNNDEFTVYDVDPPDEAHEVRSLELDESVNGICVHEGYAYIANGNSGVTIIDTLPPERAEAVASIGIVGSAGDVDAGGGFVYAACSEEGLQIFDVSDPTSPEIANVLDTPGNAYGVEVSGDHAYVADYLSGLRIISLW